jgi:hypothetical protein
LQKIKNCSSNKSQSNPQLIEQFNYGRTGFFHRFLKINEIYYASINFNIFLRGFFRKIFAEFSVEQMENILSLIDDEIND